MRSRDDEPTRPRVDRARGGGGRGRKRRARTRGRRGRRARACVPRGSAAPRSARGGGVRGGCVVVPVSDRYRARTSRYVSSSSSRRPRSTISDARRAPSTTPRRQTLRRAPGPIGARAGASPPRPRASRGRALRRALAFRLANSRRSRPRREPVEHDRESPPLAAAGRRDHGIPGGRGWLVRAGRGHPGRLHAHAALPRGHLEAGDDQHRCAPVPARPLDDALGPSIARPDGVGTPREAFAPPANARSRSLAPRVIFPAGARSRGSFPRRSIS